MSRVNEKTAVNIPWRRALDSFEKAKREKVGQTVGPENAGYGQKERKMVDATMRFLEFFGNPAAIKHLAP